MLTQAPRGTRDVLPEEAGNWVFLENKFREICHEFSYKEIRTPVFEHTELFQRGVGETTDIVEKEMYTFQDKSGRSITLKPEGTAPTVRAYIEHKLYTQPMPVKLFYIIPGFRYERPQAGRLREFHQFGIEAFGSDSPHIDVEIMVLGIMFLKNLGLDDIKLHINSIGCEICRADYKKALKDFLGESKQNLCNTCNSRLNRNPLRILDCKNPECQRSLKEAPVVLDYLCDECKAHFEAIKNDLSLINIDYTVNPRIVRGLDYYTRTVFEIISEDLGAQSTVCGGGRYDNLIQECGGPPTPAAGFGMGIERLITILEKKNLLKIPEEKVDIYIAPLKEEYVDTALKLLYSFRESGISAETDYLKRSLKAQMKYANKIMAQFAIIIGEEEVNSGFYTVKDLTAGEQQKVARDKIFEYISNCIRKGCDKFE
ncbi:MAG: histidyl-tRNA synthetase [Thermoanaerobacteraceae bacterium]|nr:histidyl-tRNA synthetase [Thermoanaerobacteraceae bacterium]